MQGCRQETSGVDRQRAGAYDGSAYIYIYKLGCSSDSKAQAVRWGVDAILTDFTRTWLDMRTALYCMCHHFNIVATAYLL